MKDAESVQATQENEESSKKLKRDPGMVINCHRKSSETEEGQIKDNRRIRYIRD